MKNYDKNQSIKRSLTNFEDQFSLEFINLFRNLKPDLIEIIDNEFLELILDIKPYHVTKFSDDNETKKIYEGAFVLIKNTNKEKIPHLIDIELLFKEKFKIKFSLNKELRYPNSFEVDKSNFIEVYVYFEIF